MSEHDPRDPRKPGEPHPAAEERDESPEDEAGSIKATLPMGSIPVVDHDFNPESSATLKMQSVTYPPEQWGKERDLISSASAPTSQRMNAVSGTVTLNSERMPESLARELISRRFAQYDYALVSDFPFAYHDTVVVLDGFDPNRRVGYQYISHADQDVVTDHDAATSETFRLLEAEGLARVLVIHDGEVITGDALIAMVDQFLATPSPG